MEALVDGLYRDWYACLVRYALSVAGSLQTAEDVVQESFMALYRELLDGQHIDSPKGWTLCVVRRELIKLTRQQERHGGPFQSLSDFADFPDRHADEQGQCTQDWTIGDLLGVLSRREQEVILMRVKGLKYRQIASALGVSINSVKTLLARALKKMRKVSETGASQAGSSLEADEDTVQIKV